MTSTKKVSVAALTKKVNLTSSKALYHRINWYAIMIVSLAVTPVLVALASFQRGYLSVGGEAFIWIVPLVLGLENDPRWRAHE